MKCKLNDLSLVEKIGQQFIIGITNKAISDKEINFIKKYNIGGVILYKDNYTNYEEMLEYVNKLKKIKTRCNIPLFIAIDQEGGRVNRMPSEFHNIRNASLLASKNDLELIRASAKVTSQMLLQTGINLNFAPVLDIKRFDDNNAIGNRCFGTNSKDVITSGIEYMKELQKNNILSVVKHFPGMGISSRDSHILLPIVKKYTYLKEDLEPFKKAINDKADALMIGHVLIKDINNYYPISLDRKFINEEIRIKLKYKGLIITDDLRMRGISLIYKTYNCVKRALLAGNDMIIIKYRNNDQFIIEKLAKKIENNTEIISNIDKSIIRILKAKEKYMNNKTIKGCNIQKINKEIDNINQQLM